MSIPSLLSKKEEAKENPGWRRTYEYVITATRDFSNILLKSIQTGSIISNYKYKSSTSGHSYQTININACVGFMIVRSLLVILLGNLNK